ncbi:MAG TPA: hypothetical protein VMZ53_19490 [Kofleriaceae bacterium]|nr:hypothetical protein [Kofleriaceae bacterium]
MSHRLAVVVVVAVATSGCRYLLGDADEARDSGSNDSDTTNDPRCGWGSSGLPQGGICLDELPSEPVSLGTSLDTDTSPLCVAYSKGGGTYCVIAGTTITIDSVRVVGSKPLVVVATESVSVVGASDLASRTVGPPAAGSDPANGCDAGIGPNDGNNPETRGGAGGSFGGRGGRGGLRNAQPPSPTSGVPGQPVQLAAPATLRGGCRGQDGFGAGGALGGAGGGAVYVIAANQIDIATTGSLNASGAGGAGGAVRRGGAGGGSGGMIVLDALVVNIRGAVFANGGGGGEGGGMNNPGNPGGDSDGTLAAPGGNGGAGEGSDGGAGSFQTMLDGSDPAQTANTESGGGGGGAAGVIWIHATSGERAATTSPPAAAI